MHYVTFYVTFVQNLTITSGPENGNSSYGEVKINLSKI